MIKYDNIADPSSRKRFLKMFKENSGSLKWAFNFKIELLHEDTTELSSNAEYRTPGEILRANGRLIDSFPSIEEAMVDVLYLVERNQVQQRWTEEQHPALLDEKMPAYSKFWYVKSNGTTELIKQTQKKELTGDAVLKNIGQIEEGMHFMEGLGFEERSEVSIENVKFAVMLTQCEALK